MPPPRSPPRGPAWGPRAGPPWGAPTGAPADPRGAPHGGLVGGHLKGGGMANPNPNPNPLNLGGGRCSERSGNTFRRSVFRTFRVPCKLRRPPPRASVNLVPLLLTGVRLHPPGRTDKNLCRCFGAPATHARRPHGRVFPDHLINLF